MTLILLGVLCSAATQMLKLLIVQPLLKDTDPRQNAVIQIVAMLLAYGLVTANAYAAGLALTFAAVWNLLPQVLVVFGAATGAYHLASSKGTSDKTDAPALVGGFLSGPPANPFIPTFQVIKPGLATSNLPVSEPLFPAGTSPAPGATQIATVTSGAVTLSALQPAPAGSFTTTPPAVTTAAEPPAVLPAPAEQPATSPV